MADAREKTVRFDASCCSSPQGQVGEDVNLAVTQNPSCGNETPSHCMFGFPAASSDIVICSGSPDLATRTKQEHEMHIPLDQKILMLGTERLEASFELPVAQDAPDDPGDGNSQLSINAGELDTHVVNSSTDFQKDRFFSGGDTIRTDEKIGEGRWLELYQTARVGNFSYRFDTLECGEYVVDLHFAEIVFTQGPPGLRTFDIFIQEEKVVSGLDIYAQVGPNQPLILSDLRTSVMGNEGLVIRFEEVNGSPIVCGISIRSYSSTGKGLQRSVETSTFQFQQSEISKDDCKDCRKIKRDYDLLFAAQAEIQRALEQAKKENELKSKESHEAWMQLQDLRMELMRKSMHVGSLAFAVEGQVKEKSRWFSALRELTTKFELLKLEHAKLVQGTSEHKKCIADMASMTTYIQSAVNNHALLGRDLEELKQKFVREAKKRKELYNKVLELKGNIRVFCRCRPLNINEVSKGVPMVVDFESAKDGELIVRAPGAPKKVFKFDSVFSPEASQESVFEDTSPLAASVLDGYNVCIFAYGQTGTGKTFTMEGTKEARGVNYKILEELFRLIKERYAFFRYEISVSVLEVYNEQIHDLLLSDSQSGVAVKRLEIRQVSDGAHHIPGLVEATVSNMNEVWEVLQTGSNARAVGSTNANEHSSRSHCIHCVMVKGENLMSGECTRSKLWLIDLAGSERVAKTDAQGERLKEAQCINRSLSALGDVISALATKSPHVPFRNSKLTHLLQDSLGGDSKALMFVQVSPSENDVSETLCSLNFASRVRGIELGPAKKQFDSTEISRQKQMLEKAKQEIKVRDAYIKKMEETIQCNESKMKAKDSMNKNLQDKIKELESQLLIERKLARQHVDSKIAEQQKQHRQQQKKSSLANYPLLVKSQNQREEPTTAFREIGNVIAPSTENNINDLPRNFPLLKENRATAEDLVSRKSNRLSLCPSAQRTTPIIPAARRESLIPFPATGAMGSPLLTPAHNSADSLPEPLPTTATVHSNDAHEDVHESVEPKSSKKNNSILRRSLQKKIIIRPGMQQQVRKGGGRRVPVGSKAPGNPLIDRSESHRRQKERGWNQGTAVRNII